MAAAAFPITRVHGDGVSRQLKDAGVHSTATGPKSFSSPTRRRRSRRGGSDIGAQQSGIIFATTSPGWSRLFFLSSVVRAEDESPLLSEEARSGRRHYSIGERESQSVAFFLCGESFASKSRFHNIKQKQMTHPKHFLKREKTLLCVFPKMTLKLSSAG